MRKYLKHMRNARHLSQLKTSQFLDISESYYCQIELGERQKGMTLPLMIKLADVFGVDLSTIVQYESEYLKSLNKNDTT